MSKGCQYVANPFQVLGKTDEENGAPIAPSSPSVDVAPVVEPAPPAPAPPAPIAKPVQILESRDAVLGAVSLATASPRPLAPSHPELTFLHHIGSILLDDVLPLVLQVGLPILERKI
jgi:hypothetical protein